MYRESSSSNTHTATKMRPCSFWNPQTNSGCRKGDHCEFFHQAANPPVPTQPSAASRPLTSAWNKPSAAIRYQPAPAAQPTPQALSPPIPSPPATVVGDDIEKLYLERAGVCKLTAADYKRLVVHCRHSPYDEYIGRKNPSVRYTTFKWGNPFKMEQESDRDQVTRQYELWLLNNPQLIAEAKRELKGKVLACWCAPKKCHGLVLCRVANSE